MGLYTIVHKLDKQCDHCGVHQLLLLSLEAIQVRDGWFHFSEVQSKMFSVYRRGPSVLFRNNRCVLLNEKQNV